MDGRKDAAEQSATDSHLSKLERDGAGMADNPRTNFDQPGLQARQRPIGHFLGKVCILQEDAEIIRQCMKLEPDLILRHALAGQARPVDGLLAFLDVLLGGATLIVEMDDPFGVHRQVGHDKADGVDGSCSNRRRKAP